MTGCMNAPVKKTNLEMWFINNEEQLLYRTISDESETVIPIKSKSVRKFMCIDKDKYKDLIDTWVTE